MIKRVHFKVSWLPYAFLLPQLTITSIFFLWPAGETVYQAFTQQDAWGINPPTFVGWENFQTIWTDPDYRHTFWRTIGFTAAVTALSMSVALILAGCADYLMKKSHFYRSFLIVPYAVAPVLAGSLWLFLFNPTLGIVSNWLKDAGIPWNHYLNGNQAFLLVIIAAAWNHISYNFLFFLAGMQSIPRSLIEAAAIDGAGPVRRFRDHIIPLLTPTIFFLIIMNLTYSFFDTFGIIHGVTQGGPGNATTTLVYKVFADGYIGHQHGIAGAQSVIMILLVVILTIVQFRFVERKVSYA